MIGCKEISGIRSKKCKFLLVERQDTKYYLLVYAKPAVAQLHYDMLRNMRLKGVRVPKVVQIADGEVLLEYVEGSTLYEEVCQGPVFKLSMLATALAKLLREFCDLVPEKRMGDIDLRGYIVRGSTLYGMDYDCIILGTYAEAVADAMCSVICESKIAKDRQLSFCKYLFAASKLSAAAIKEALAEVYPLCAAPCVKQEDLLRAIF